MPGTAQAAELDGGMTNYDAPIPTTPKRNVKFNLSPEQQSFSDSELSRAGSSHSRRRSNRRSHKRNDSPASDGSSDTIELPPRFDEHGRPIERSDSVANAVEQFLSGRNYAGSVFNHVVDEFLGTDKPGKRRRRSR